MHCPLSSTHLKAQMKINTMHKVLESKIRYEKDVTPATGSINFSPLT